MLVGSSGRRQSRIHYSMPSRTPDTDSQPRRLMNGPTPAPPGPNVQAAVRTLLTVWHPPLQAWNKCRLHCAVRARLAGEIQQSITLPGSSSQQLLTVHQHPATDNSWLYRHHGYGATQLWVCRRIPARLFILYRSTAIQYAVTKKANK